jgi:Zn-dependent protease with chaperone function
VPLEGEAGKEDEKSAKKAPSFDLGYLSTHPATAERIQAAEEAAAK